jgi:hypothetical protein
MKTIDICFRCKEEKNGEYVGDFDNPIFVCFDCQDESLEEEIVIMGVTK